MLQVVVISHAYIEEELRKGVAALADRLDVRVISPASADCLVFSGLNVGDSESHIELFDPLRTVRLFGAQYVFLSPDLGFRRRPPDVICVDYDPWAIVFWQTLLCSRLFARRSVIVCSAKKNTYRRFPVFGWVKSLAARVGIRRTSKFIAASHRTARMYEDIFGVDKAIIEVMTHLGVDTDHFAPPADPRPIEPDRAVVGYVGRLERHKGIEDLVSAIEHLRSVTELDVRLNVCGSGSLAAELAEMAGSRPWLSVESAVPNNQVPPFLRGLDIFVLPARVLPDHEEHDAHALIEALACGLPCIATRSGINAELLGDGTGVLVEPQQPLELASAIGALVPDVALRRELSSHGRQRAVAEFDNHRLAQRKAELFKEVAK